MPNIISLQGSEPVSAQALPCSHDFHGQFDCGINGDPVPGFDHDHCLQYKTSDVFLGLKEHLVPFPSYDHHKWCVAFVIYYTWPYASGNGGLEIRSITSCNTLVKCQFYAKYICNHEALANL